MKLQILFVTCIFACFGCEEVINLDLPNSNPKLVVDGLITDLHEPCIVTISKTSQYNFDNSNTQALIEGAIVILKDDAGNIDTLDEISTGRYVSDTSKILGVVGRSYSIEIQTLDFGNWISNPEKMVAVPKIDSIYFERDWTDRSTENPIYYKYRVFIDWQDPANEKNFYLRNVSYFWGNVWHSNFTWNWVIDDKYFDGNEMVKYLISEDYGGVGFIVKLKQYSLTADAYRFWGLVIEQTLLTSDAVVNSSVPLYGNVFNNDNPSEYALGYFQISAVDSAIVDINR
jgi:hypothetical protein